MPSDYTVIQPVRQRFGVFDQPFDEEPQAPFVGLSKDFPFSCPAVDPSEMAVLQFESLGVTAGRYWVLSPNVSGPDNRDILQINGVSIPGAITPSDANDEGPILEHFWNFQSLLVPANVLYEEGNVLHIESAPIPISGGYRPDNFIIDNIVLFFKTLVKGRFVAGQDLASRLAIGACWGVAVAGLAMLIRSKFRKG
jgi:hypothetical protein